MIAGYERTGFNVREGSRMLNPFTSSIQADSEMLRYRIALVRRARLTRRQIAGFMARYERRMA